MRLNARNSRLNKSTRILVSCLVIILGVGVLLVAGSASLSQETGACNCGASLSPQGSAQTVFYVATDGNDAWSGKIAAPNKSRTDGPFRTIRKAKDAIRGLKASDPLKEPVTVYIRGGIYRLTSPLVFTPEDSGTAQDPVTYAAYPGETPVISGGRSITGWQRVRNRKLLAQAGGDLWMARLPSVKEGKGYFRELFVDGHRRQRARLPATGFFQVDGNISKGQHATFRFHPGDIQPQWAEQPNVEVVALQDWAEFRMHILRVDEATHTVTLSATAAPSNHEKNARYWVENTIDALGAPGQWFLDRTHGILYYRPQPGENMHRVRVIAPVLGTLVSFEGRTGSGWVEHIRLRGLMFEYTDWSIKPGGYVDLQAAYDIPAAVKGMGVRSCSIERCTLAHLGGYAIALSGGPAQPFGLREGSKSNRVAGNDLYDLGAGGIKIGDPECSNSEAQTTDGNVVSNNHIHDIGKVFPAGVGVWVGESSDNTISHNEIDDTYYTGISVGWTWGYGPSGAAGNRIEFNDIDDIGRGLLSDMGCIYTLGVQPGTVEKNNLCHDVSRYLYGGWGIYTDEGSSDILIENNVVYRTEDAGFHQNYGANNIVRNNIFAYGRTSQIRRSHNEPHLSFTAENNIFYWNSGPLMAGIWTDNEYRFDHNLYFRTDGRPILFGKKTFAEWQAGGQDRHSLIADPLFPSPSNGDFALRPYSPAASIGFNPIDLSRVGPQSCCN